MHGIPRNLLRMGSGWVERVGRVLREGPILFLAIVIGVAVTFKITMSWARQAIDEPTADPAALALTAAKPTPAPTPTVTSQPTARAEEPQPLQQPLPAASAAPAFPRKKARAHGRR